MKNSLNDFKLKKLREGFTTGACAAAAARIGFINLLSEKTVFSTEVWFPNNKFYKFKALWIKKEKNLCEVAIKKFAGDDPDITNGAIIGAKVAFSGKKGISIVGGNGVGKVTKKGLAVPPGKPAINPVPLLMIRKNLELINKKTGLTVEIFVENGEKLSEKTLNKKLGIIGGISILGTTGIVKPVSVDAYLASIEVELNVAKAANINDIFFVTGRTSEKIAMENFPYTPEEAFVTIGDHIGFSLQKAVEMKFASINIVGQFGKFTKIASGEFQTHVKHSTIFIKNLIHFISDKEKKDHEFIKLINESISARHVFETALEKGYENILNNITEKVAINCYDFILKKCRINTLLAGYKEGIFAKASIG